VAAHSGSLTASHERELLEAVDILSKVARSNSDVAGHDLTVTARYAPEQDL
jgi:hypothetical protein